MCGETDVRVTFERFPLLLEKVVYSLVQTDIRRRMEKKVVLDMLWSMGAKDAAMTIFYSFAGSIECDVFIEKFHA